MCPYRGEQRMTIEEDDFVDDPSPSNPSDPSDVDLSSDSEISSEDMLSVGTTSDEDSDDDEDDDTNAPEEQEPAGNLRLDVDLGELAEGREDETDDDAVIQAILRSRHHTSTHPPLISVEDSVSDISFHPSLEIIAIGTFTGDIKLYQYDNTENKLLSEHEVHLEACRHIEFDGEGELIYSCSKDKSIAITDVNTGKLIANYDNAHEDALYSLHLLNENLFVSGCESGYIKLWDRRQRESVFSLQLMEDQVNSMICDIEKRTLVATCGGCLHAINLRQRKLKTQSEEYSHDLTSMGFIRHDSKLLVGSSKGILYVFNWGDFGYHEDEFPGKHPINQMLCVTENIAVIACEDGAIRATFTYPHRFLGVVGQHEFGVDSLDINRDGKLIASAAGDTVVKFWDIDYLEEVEVATSKTNKDKDLKNNLPSSEQANRGSFFADLAAPADAAQQEDCA